MEVDQPLHWLHWEKCLTKSSTKNKMDTHCILFENKVNTQFMPECVLLFVAIDSLNC